MTLYTVMHKVLLYFKVNLLPVADIRNPSLVNNFVEVTDTGVKSVNDIGVNDIGSGVKDTRVNDIGVNGLLCYDDVDTKTLEVLCRSLSPPQYLLAHRYNTHNLYKGL